MHKFHFDIDITGACNLRCPSCPQGSVKDYRLPHGFMGPELLKQIVAKATSECLVARISLYNWAEPLLHPQVAALVRIVEDAGIPCELSSNLQILPDADAIMAANPTSFRVSVSGFRQEIYGRTHRGGDIEKVKKHLVELVAAKKRHEAKTVIYVYYHRYRHNLQDVVLMRDFAAGLGIKFLTDWAMMFPLEKILAVAGEGALSLALTEEDQSLIDSLALPLREALTAAQKYRDHPCPLRDDAMTLDCQGNISLCCGVFDAREYTLGKYLEMPVAEIQRIKESHPLCGRCMRQGAHIYLTYGIDEMDELALANISPADAELLDLHHEIARKRRQQRRRKLYQRYVSGLLSSGQKDLLAERFLQLQRFIRRGRRNEPDKGEKS